MVGNARELGPGDIPLPSEKPGRAVVPFAYSRGGFHHRRLRAAQQRPVLLALSPRPKHVWGE